jgi:WD40 repeat protein
MLEQKLISGYDGFGGVHDNLLWNVTAGFTYYTLNNKLIIENTKTREQTVLADSTVQLSCIAGSADGKYIAVGEGSPNAQGNAIAYLYDVETVPPKRLPSRLAFHQKGIQSMAFSYDSKYLITLGVQGDDTLAVTKIS